MWPFNKCYCPSGQNMIYETQTDQSEENEVENGLK
jgi:hypothetical protein